MLLTVALLCTLGSFSVDSRFIVTQAMGVRASGQRAQPFAPQSPPAQTGFTRLEVREIGIDKPLAMALGFADADRDGDLDLTFGNDFDIADYVYMGDGSGAFAQVTHGDGIVLHVITTTMAIQRDDAPEVHFGLGAVWQVTQARIRWANGGETVIDGPLEAGSQYRILRQGAQGQGCWAPA